MKRIILSITITLLMSSGAWGATVYVKPGSAHPTTAVQYKSGASSCSDASGWTDDSTLQTAVTTTGSGGMLNICAGRYVGSMIDTADNLDVGFSMTLTGIGTVVIDGSTVSDHVVDWSSGVSAINNITITGAKTNYYNLRVYNQSTLTDVNIDGGDRAIYMNGAYAYTFIRGSIQNHTNTSYIGINYVDGSSVTFLNTIIKNNASHLRGYYTSTWAFVNCTMVGAGRTVFKHDPSGGKTITSEVKNCIITGNDTAMNMGSSGNYVLDQNSNGTMTVSYSNILPSGINPSSKLFGGTVTESHNTYTTPGFTTSKYPLVVVFRIDDSTNIDFWASVADYSYNTYRYPTTIAVFPGVSSVTESQWTVLKAKAAQGHEIASHTVDHVYLTQANAYQVTGPANSRFVQTNTVSDTDPENWTGTAILYEDSVAVKTYNYDYTTSTNTLLLGLARAGWTFTVSTNANYTKAVCHTNVDQANPSSYQVTISATPYYDYEIKYSKTLIDRLMGDGYATRTMIYPYGQWNNDVITYIKNNTDYIGASEVSGANQDFVNNINIYKISAFHLDTYIGVSNVARNTNALLEMARESGRIIVFLGHGSSEYSLANWETVIDTVHAAGATVMTLGDAVTWLETYSPSGDVTSADGLTYTRTLVDQSNYKLSPTSPAINAGTPVDGVTYSSGTGLPLYDYTGAVFYNRYTPSIGAYSYLPPLAVTGTGPFTVTGGTGQCTWANPNKPAWLTGTASGDGDCVYTISASSLPNNPRAIFDITVTDVNTSNALTMQYRVGIDRPIKGTDIKRY